MVSAFIFLLHVVAAVAAFVIYKKQGTSEGWLAVAFVAIVFSVGWVIATLLTNLLFLPEVFVGWYYRPLDSRFWLAVRKEFNRDTISLLFLTLGEWGFYFLYFGGGKNPEKMPQATSDGK